MTESLGARIRRKRLKKGLGLRKTAKNAGISATFLSRVETGLEKAIPSEMVIRKLADLIEDNFDELMSLAGRIPAEVADYVKAEPRMPEFLRRAKAKKVSADRLIEMLKEIKD
jgi:transcriptional regulator with XRE-family HTH domain